MNPALDDIAPRRDSVSIPAIWIAAAVSVVLHALVLSGWLPRLPLPSPDKYEPLIPPLTVRLLPPPGPAGTPVAPPPAKAAPEAPARTLPRPQTAPRVMTRSAPERAPLAEGPVLPATPSSAPGGDFASFVDARRRARNESAPAEPAPSAPAPVEDENARRNRIAAANINPQGPMAFGYDPSRSGGVFHVERLTSDYAELLFFGWHIAAKRNMMQRVEVSRGNNPDIRIAVVRKMIAIIRQYEQEDFQWDSRRLRRSVTLSARQRDTAGLEEFLMREFFEEPRERR